MVGTSGHPNYADELATAGWLKFLAQQHPDTPVILDCPKPGLASFLFDRLHPNLRTTDLLWRTVWETVEMSDAEADERIDQRVDHLGFPDYDIAMLAARQATKFHVLGGGYFTHFWPHHVRLLRVVSRISQLSGAPAYATGLGLVPSPAPERAREYLSSFASVSVTDRPSAELLGTEIAAPVVGDDSLLELASVPGYTNRATPAGPDELGAIWVCLQRDLADEAAFEGALETVRGVLTSPLAKGRELHYLEAIPGTDRIAYERLSDLIPEANFMPFVRLWHEGFPAKPRQIWLTTRARVHLFAAACGAAGLAIPVESEYYPIKHEQLLADGTGWRVTRPGAGEPDRPAGGQEFRMTAARLQRQKLAEAERIYPRVSRAYPRSL